MTLTRSIMNVQAEKLQLIEWLVKLEDTNVLQQLQKLRDEEFVRAYEANLKPMTKEELIARAEESNRAITAGDVVDVESILEEVG